MIRICTVSVLAYGTKVWIMGNSLQKYNEEKTDGLKMFEFL